MERHSDLRGEIAMRIGMRGQWHGYRGAFDVSARAKTIDTLREAMSYRLLLEGQRESRASDIAALGGGPLASLQRTYSRSFADEGMSEAARA